MVTFQEVWQVFSTGRGTVYGLDAIDLSIPFRIAEMELRDDFRAQSMRKMFLEDQSISVEQLDELVLRIKQNTKFKGSAVFNKDGRRRYENLADVGFMITSNGEFQTIVLSDIK